MASYLRESISRGCFRALFVIAVSHYVVQKMWKALERIGREPMRNSF
jgi:hypothetical protein